MDNTSKLEQLIAQRKEIDRRIKELANSKYEVDGARMLLKKYKTDKSDEWVVTLEEIDGAQGKSSAYKQIISAKSCNDAIEYIETQIAVLQMLLDRVRESIMSAHSIIAHSVPYEERSQGEWIPVSERLPKEGNICYLVTVDYGGITSSCQRFFYSDEIGWNDDSVIAWMPLPEPYKKGGVV